ncbi:hypothetical protein Clacol_002555 [Clathrus columnatus]|uniref:Calcium-transporting ATPase n=1 Tax=Clathrus columnatus TaxID=1419009 RepID=A0AAV5A533_9AGAM|nr:hypothetical protein Clacol_002555 [Clathrus columnatus]
MSNLNSKRTIPEISITTSSSNLNLTEDSPSVVHSAQSQPSPLTPPSLNLPSGGEENNHHLQSRPLFEPATDPNLLSPSSITPILRPHSPAPSSPSGSDHASIFSSSPPSPTLTASSSVHFHPSYLALRENNPHKRLSPDRHHFRRPSDASQATSFDGSLDGTDYTHYQHLPLTSLGNSKGDSSSVTDLSRTVSINDASYIGLTPKDGHKFHSETNISVNNNDNSNTTSQDQTTPLPDENIDPAPFVHNPWRLASLVDPKSLDALTSLGGVDELIKGLGTDSRQGLSKHALGLNNSKTSNGHASSNGSSGGDDRGGGDTMDGNRAVPHSEDRMEDSPPRSPYSATLADRKRVFGENILPARKSKSLLLLMWLAFKDKVLILLSIAAVVSLALGFFQDFGTPPETVQCGDDPSQQCTLPKVDWVEGVAIICAIIIVVVVGSLNDWQKERQFQKLNEKKEDRGVKVIRHGVEMIINVKEVLVGDIALLEPGEVVPCDGVFLRGHNVRCDESGATGESDAIRKASYAECMTDKERGDLSSKKDCFVLSGSKVIEGVGEYVVIAVGTKSFNGRIMMALRGDTENTPLQLKLNDLAELIAKLGSAAGLILFSVLMIKFFVQLKTESQRSGTEKALSFVQILIISVTLIVVAVPEGLPLAVTLALAFATKRMTKANLLVRVLGSCETMANTSVVCTDKTGTLTQNTMSVVAGSLGVHCKFVRNLEDNQARTNASEQSIVERKHNKDFSVDQADLNSVMTDSVKKLMNEAIAVNSTAFEDTDHETGKMEFVGSKTESALLRMAQDLNWQDYKQTRDSADILQLFPFSSERKAMAVIVRTEDKKVRLYVKGASEILTKLCTRHIVIHPPDAKSSDSQGGIETNAIGDLERDNISRTIIFYANQTLRTIALCYRDLESWPPKGFSMQDDIPWAEFSRDLTLIAITGIEDPLRPGVRDAVASCHKAGVQVKMCTGDNVLTARSIAIQCGIFTKGGIIMEGPVFRKLNAADMMDIIPRLQVLARSSPEDKKILVEKLKQFGETVGVTGDGTNDGPALKTANVGFSMGIAGTEVAKEASDIILMDDNFTSIINAIMWGRCVNDAVRKFLQFQLSVNVAAVLITFVTAVASGTETSVLSAVQLLWINIIMDTFAALALATDPASRELLNRKPDSRSAPLFSVPMRKQILGQSLYQTAVILIFHFAGNRIFGYGHEDNQALALQHQHTLQTLVFNIFVFCQIFNSFNCRSVDNKRNIFEGITSNWYFMAITAIEIGVQVLIVYVGGAAFQVTPIGGREWGISIAFGFMSIPIGFLLRLIPDEYLEKWLIKLHLMADTNSVLPVTSPDQTGWNPAINLVRDNLETFANIRGGRLRSSSFVGKSRSARLEEAGVKLPSLLTMVPTLVATSVGAGWSPNQGSLSDPCGADPSRSSAALMDGKIQIHPETSPDDQIFKRWGPPPSPI